MILLSKLDSVDIEKVPEESLGIAAPWLSNYYHCPKCRSSVQGIFGVRDSKGVSWCLNECLECGYIYKVRTGK